ncbi:hypothetical protein DIPPA_12330 [Diplonema papillatum]|nr:hypothetical protein DIPPA_12330 [Diplonema papillatum]KAJ9453219.1 hypothetical protein DIPPA_12330 [Diplonema papillatum]KAJ9453220.1 hypothetical protein DIPPA_12330 [Diplonema papillatum]KAJ9453221.1 hypothetical protein DIPPA_12330 [Diplonema papillatum]KAJ9453222.1 hypothetical protein DIPPA_12330 [Diplonema papillatum]
MCRSSLPGEISDKSRDWGTLVAAMTVTDGGSPSISDSSCDTTLDSWPPPSPVSSSLSPKTAWTSSRNTQQGALRLALSNNSRTFFSLSPTYPFTTLGTLACKKELASSVATALASSVFPFPGRPYSKTPLNGRRPSRSFTGAGSRWTDSARRTAAFAWSWPVMSANETRWTTASSERVKKELSPRLAANQPVPRSTPPQPPADPGAAPSLTAIRAAAATSQPLTPPSLPDSQCTSFRAAFSSTGSSGSPRRRRRGFGAPELFCGVVSSDAAASARSFKTPESPDDF